MQRLGVRWRAALLGLLTIASALTVSTSAVSADQAVTVGVGTSVVSGQFHTCVLMDNQQVRCWGSDENGQIGEGGTSPSNFEVSPVVSYSPTTAASIATGGRHTCVLNTDGTVSCFGKNDFGQLGQPLSTPANPTPTTVAGISNVTSITAGEVFTCATKSDGTVWCWGDNGVGQLGVPATGLPTQGAPPSPYSPSPVQVAGVTGAIAVEAGNAFACALKTDGTVVCWGVNDVGQLGRGAVSSATSVAAAVPDLDRVASLTSGRAHTCARKTSGAVFCWGAGDAGQLGAGSTDPHYLPEVVPTLGSVRNVAASEDTTCAVRTTGTAACWGSNSNGQLGNGNKTNSLAPSTVTGLTNAVVIAPGWRHTCALLTSGTVQCWGANNVGQLGNGAGGAAAADSTSPITVPGLTAVKLDPGTVVTPGLTPGSAVTDQPYTALAAPERLLDTRAGANDVVDQNATYQGIGAISTKTLQVTGRGTTPSGAASAVLNVTVVNAGADGYLTVYPCDAAVPNASNLNFAAGDTIANAVFTKLDSSGRACIFASTSVDVLVDASGYFPTTGSFIPLAAPRRLLETRLGASPTVDGQKSNIGRPGDQAITRVPIAGRNGGEIPAGVSSVALNVTAINGGADGGYLTVWPCDDAPQPNASNVNYKAGQTIPGFVIAKVSNAGEVCIFGFKAADLAVDAVGYFTSAISYTPLAKPSRFMDSRATGATDDGQAQGKTFILDGQNDTRLRIGGRNGISASAGAVLANVTVDGPLGDGFVTVYPCGQTRPTVSSLNFKAGQTIANSVAAGVGSGRDICLYSSVPTNVIVDVAGTLS